MTAQVVDASTVRDTNTTNTSHTMDYPAAVAADELLLLFIVSEGQAPTVSAFTQVFNEATTPGRHACYARKALGSEGGGTFTITFGSTNECNTHLFRIQSWGGTIASHIVAATATSTSGIDPPNLNFGSTDDFLVFAGGGADGTTRTVSSYSSTYTNGIQDSANNNLIANCRKEVSGSSANPGTYTMSGPGTMASWTVAVAPGTAGAPAAGTAVKDVIGGGIIPFAR